MKKTNFVSYEVIVEKKVKKGNSEDRERMTLTGIIENTPHILGKIFQHHPEALDCCAVVDELYSPLYI